MTHGAYILARYSTDNQSEASIETQVEHCSAWCQKNNLSILDIFADYAVSGMKSTRPQYERMMGLLRQGGADTVVIYDQSRMFRNMISWFQFREELDGMGVRVISVTQPTVGGDLNDPANFLSEGAFALFNQMHVLQTRQKTIAGVRHRALSGKHTGGIPPLGYRVENERVVIDEEESVTVRYIFIAFYNGATFGELIRELKRQGKKTKRGADFGRNSLHDILRNPRYIGEYYFGGKPKSKSGSRNSHAKRSDDCIVIPCPAIIEKYIFDGVQRRLDANKHTGRPAKKVQQPLKSKVFCGDCGSAMTLSMSSAKNKARYYYYKCAAKKRGMDCPSRQIRKDELEDLVADAIRQQLGTPEAKSRLLSVLRQQRDQLQFDAEPQLQQLRKQLKNISAQLDNSTNAILAGLTSQALIDKINRLEEDKTAIEAQIKAMTTAVRRTKIDDSKLDKLLDDLIVSAADDPDSLYHTVIRVEVYPDTLKIWTIFDPDPSKPSDEPELTKHNVNTIVPIPAPPLDCVEMLGTPPAYQQLYAKWLVVAFPARRLRRQ